MENLILPKQYKSELNLHDTQLAIKTVKDFFQALLAQRLHLTRVSAPLFVDPATGLNDNLNGYERPVTFGIKEQDDKNAEVVHSLAKWKRYALKKYGFQVGEGIYTDMNAIRRDESTDNIHSIFVDQWDWEKIIHKEDRNLDYLKETVRTVYKCLRKTEQYMAIQYDYIDLILPKEIFFITSQELEDLFPDNTPKEREYYITKAKGTRLWRQGGEGDLQHRGQHLLGTGGGRYGPHALRPLRQDRPVARVAVRLKREHHPFDQHATRRADSAVEDLEPHAGDVRRFGGRQRGPAPAPEDFPCPHRAGQRGDSGRGAALRSHPADLLIPRRGGHGPHGGDYPRELLPHQI